MLARLFFLTILLVPAPALAHPLAPSLLEIRERSAGILDVRWRTPTQRVPGSELAPLLPAHCSIADSRPARLVGSAIEAGWTLDCGRAPLAGTRLAAQGIAESGADVLLRIVTADGRNLQSVLTADTPDFVVPERQGSAAVARAYFEMGLAHILTGWDHLLFVLGLVLMVAGGAALVRTITAFTVGHSVTLSLAALGVLPVAQQAAEAAIALSILALAWELGRDTPGPLRRYPWTMAAAFGLLHGLGFAGALAEAGLPAGEVPLALASFNVGIEAGQLAFVAVVLATGATLGRAPWQWSQSLRWLPVYVIGTCAAFWLLERGRDLLI